MPSKEKRTHARFFLLFASQPAGQNQLPEVFHQTLVAFYPPRGVRLLIAHFLPGFRWICGDKAQCLHSDAPFVTALVL
jgi:hypothetical protein